MMRSSIPEVSPAWADALLAARLLARFGPWAPNGGEAPLLCGIHLRARCGPVLDAWLEQLRALENGMRIDAAIVDTVPLGVDTPADLERARQILAQ